MRVSELMVGQTVRVVGFLPGDKVYRQKLTAMGFTPSAVFRVLRMAPLGDPIEIEIRGTMLSLRKEEANIMRIEEV